MATTNKPESETTVKDLLARVDKEDISFIRLWFTDILGQLKSFAVGKNELEGALTEGMGFDGSSITGFNRIEESDMIAMPDRDTFEVLPWRPSEKGVARMFCDVLVPGGEPYEGDPRYVMRRALARAQEMGFDHFYLGPELEYFYFRSDELNGGSPQVLDKGGYFDLTTLDAGSDLRRDTVLALEAMGIDVEYTHHEVGPSQHEIDMRFADGLRMADNAMTYRIVVKEIAMKYGVYATFMPKPLFGENGSGMHVHQSLFSGTSNAFFDADDEYHLSPVAKSFIAGQLRHAREISALFAQWVNSYKRLVLGYEAPVYIAWSPGNRSAAIRVPAKRGRSTRIELRTPDPTANPYLALACMLEAGLNGIKSGAKPPEPVNRNIYDLTEEESGELGITSLPHDLTHAIDALEADSVVREALGEHIFSEYVRLKRGEWAEYNEQVHRWELDQYMDRY